MLPVAHVAEYIIGTEMRRGAPVTPLRLALYLYFAQVESFAACGRPLFFNEISTARPFPCVDSVHYKYNVYTDGITLNLQRKLPPEEAALVRPLIARLRKKNTWELVAMAEQPCSPFMKAKKENVSLTPSFFKKHFFKKSLTFL